MESPADGPLAEAVRIAEVGFRAQLNAILDAAAPDDPVRARCLRWLVELATTAEAPTLEAPAATAEAPTAPPPPLPPPVAVPVRVTRPDPLRDRLVAAWKDAAWARLFGPIPADVEDGAALWTRLHWLARRRRVDDETAMIAALARVARAIGATNDDAAVVVCGPEGVEIVPGLTGTVTVPGWAVSTSEPLPEEISLPADADPVLSRLAAVVGLALALADQAPGVCFAHSELDRQRWVRHDSVTIGLYRAIVLRRWADLLAPAPDAPAAWQRHVRLDEALHAILFDPPAAPGSWWERTLLAARFALLDRGKRLAAAAGLTADWSLLRGRYADVSARTDGTDVAWPGEPVGEAIWCLRVSSSAGTERWPGRVVFTPR